MTEQPQRNEGVTLLGVTFAYPRTLWGALPFAFVCAAIAFIVFLVLPSSLKHAEKPRRLWTPIVVLTNGIQTILGDTRRMEFWTPSAKTKDCLAKDGGAIPDRERWEVIPSDEPVLQFGALLRSDPNVAGYRRTEVWGHGRTVPKPGWWWTMTVTTNYSVEMLMRAYRDFWKSPNTVFVEVIDNRGREE